MDKKNGLNKINRLYDEIAKPDKKIDNNSSCISAKRDLFDLLPKIEAVKNLANLDSTGDVYEYLLDRYLKENATDEDKLMTIDDVGSRILILDHTCDDHNPKYFDIRTHVIIEYVCELSDELSVRTFEADVATFEELRDTWNNFIVNQPVKTERCIISADIDLTEFDKKYIDCIKNTMIYHGYLDEYLDEDDKEFKKIMKAIRNCMDKIDPTATLYWPRTGLAESAKDGYTKKVLFKTYDWQEDDEEETESGEE